MKNQLAPKTQNALEKLPIQNDDKSLFELELMSRYEILNIDRNGKIVNIVLKKKP
jgi:hypothetical protein